MPGNHILMVSGTATEQLCLRLEQAVEEGREACRSGAHKVRKIISSSGSIERVKETYNRHGHH